MIIEILQVVLLPATIVCVACMASTRAKQFMSHHFEKDRRRNHHEAEASRHQDYK